MSYSGLTGDMHDSQQDTSAAVRVSNTQSQFPIFLRLLCDFHCSSLFSIVPVWRVGRQTNCYCLAQCWKVRMRCPWCYFFFSDFYLDIEVEDVSEDVKRSYYSVKFYVGDNKVAKSTKSKPQLSVVKWEWKANNQIWAVVLWLISKAIFTS